MDNQQQQRINAAAQQFTDALVAASRATSDRSVAAQKLGTQMTGYFFNSVINNLRTQAEGTRQVRQQLADQQRRAQEATREFTQASTNTYMNLLDSISSFYQGGTTRAQRRAEEAERRAEEAESQVKEAERQAEQAERSTEEAKRRAEEAEKRAEEAEKRTEEAESRAEQAERSTEEAERRTEQAETNTEEAQRRAEEAETNTEEAQRQTQKAEERAEEAEKRTEEAERQVEQAQRRAEQAGRNTEKAQRRAEEAERSSSEAESQGEDDLPLADYDSLNYRQISERLDELSVEEIRRLRDYEARNKNRSTLVNRLDSRIESSSSQ
jgi:chromosome segregation ATPase